MAMRETFRFRWRCRPLRRGADHAIAGKADIRWAIAEREREVSSYSVRSPVCRQQVLRRMVTWRSAQAANRQGTRDCPTSTWNGAAGPGSSA